jgi:hypothetical protein
MEQSAYKGKERRQFIRLPYRTPLKYKICKEETIKKIMYGYTQNISQSGLLCDIKEPVPINSVLWLALDMGALSICSEIEKRSIILQHGILGRVVRTYQKKDGTFDVGIRFLTREEPSDRDLFQKVYIDQGMISSDENK